LNYLDSSMSIYFEYKNLILRSKTERYKLFVL